jgi:hypothetical protein
MSPDSRHHRGAHPADKALFVAEQLPKLQTGVSELSWLLSHAYPIKAALKLVGDRHGLTERQRLAVSRAACSNADRTGRKAHCLDVESLNGADIIVDGFNLIITIEAMLSGGVLMLCRDGCIRDLSSVHGSYRSVNETESAILLIGQALEAVHPRSVEWLLDRPISNSGRLARRIRSLADERGWPWSVELAFNPDSEIISSGKIVISSDGPLLDRVDKWVNFNQHLVEKHTGQPWLIDLSVDVQ